jgi:stage III sporulation protein AG
MNDLLAKYKNKLKSPKTLIIIGIIGIALIFLSSITGGGDKKTDKPENTEISAEEYREQLEKDIKKIVKEITGSSRVEVIVTLESGIRYKYADISEGTATDKTENDSISSSSEHKEGYITVKTADGGEEALLVTRQMPEVRGVAIVCAGGDNQIIAEKIENTVTAALNITSQRVHIAGGN